MTKFVSAALAVVAMGLLGAMPANAAWTCSGPELACTSKTKAAAKSATITSTKQVTKVAKKTWKQATYKRKSPAVKTAKRTARPRSVAASSGGSRGVASYYWQPQRVASGGWFNPNALTAAHKTLPFGTRVLVTNLNNGRTVVVTINDRGPYIRGRVIDLSRRAAQVVGMTGSGIAPVSYQILGRG